METFVIRVWMPTGDEHDADAGRLHGLVEHVRLGERSSFEDGDQLLAFLHDARTRHGSGPIETNRVEAKGERQ